jgi:hypothetical protein
MSMTIESTAHADRTFTSRTLIDIRRQMPVYGRSAPSFDVIAA